MLTSQPHLHDHTPLVERLVELARSADWLMYALGLARDVVREPWCIGAGAVRSLVWNSLHSFPLLPPSELDFVFFDLAVPQAADVDIADALQRRAPQFRWDVVNRAYAHLLSGDSTASPFNSLEHAISAWPETATAVGISMDVVGNLNVFAPLGLDDLFSLALRPSPFLRDPDAFRRRLQGKAFLTRWPRLHFPTS
jgi:uncharacterized protein